ncbi:MAG: hypothetical protein IBX72_02035 [Nitrospirae bacterium]|jgi:myo-inositol-1(or 4)-monophosphatase|nr:hypothetical protein [Nitrospirota bacterium]
MNIEILRSIGQSLLKKIPSIKMTKKIPLGIGASGDKTYQIDRIAEDTIVSHLEKSGEAFTVVSEEIGVKDIRGGGKKVLIDPIDGSRNAIAGIPFYCTSIAVIDGDTIGNIELAYIVNLINGDEFWAEKGNGAFLKGKKINTQGDEEFYLVAYEAQTPHKDILRISPLLAKSRKTRCLGATALDLAYLAHGAISVFVTPSPSRSFDFAAGCLIVREAGGVITDIKGKGIDATEVSLKKSTSLLASGNKNLHKKALRLLNT